MGLTIFHTTVSAVTTTSTNAVCPECGTSQRSGQMSCCGRGGSWFGNCGSSKDTSFEHTWHEGIQACKTRQFQALAAQQLHASQTKGNASSDVVSVDANTKVVIWGGHMRAFMPNDTSTVTSTLMSVATPTTVTVNTSVTSHNEDK